MPPPLLIDLDAVDLNRAVWSQEQIYELLPHRFEFMLLDGVSHYDLERRHLIAYADIRSDAWWLRGHVPGRPLLPGVLMLEMAAQASAFAAKKFIDHTGFIAFGGVESCKFRESVQPTTRLHLLCAGVDLRPRRVVSEVQGIVDGRLVFEARVTGLTVREPA